MKFEEFGKYTLLKKIAMGGMAEIFLARTAKIAGVSQFVVVKRILPQFSSNKNFVEMFKNEGRITAHLKHANLVYIHEFGEFQGSYYIAMEYISGCSLKDFITEVKKEHSKFPMACALYIVRSVASALHCIHNCINPETGLPLHAIHRDISPHNIMIGFNGDIKLIDFGIARTEDSDLTNSGVVKGKFSYMSPEQIKGRKLDCRTDIFSLGTVLWELISGKKLFSGANIHAIVDKVRQCRIPNIAQLRSDIPQKVHEILQMSICKDLSIRYQSAEDMERDLNLFLNEKYKSFSHLDFNTFVKNLYVDKILKERQNIVQLSKKLQEFSGQPKSKSSGLKKSSSPLAVKKKDKKKKAQTASMLSLQNTKKSRQQFSPKEKSHFKNMNSIENQRGAKKSDKETVVSPVASLFHVPTKVAEVMQDKGSARSNLSIQRNTEPSIFEQKRRSGTYYSHLTKKYGKKVKRYKRSHTFFQVFIAIIFLGGGLWVFQKFTEVKEGEELLNSSKKNQGMEPVDAYISKEIPSIAQRKNQAVSKNRMPAQKKAPRKPASVNYAKIFVETIPSGGKVFLNGKQMSEQTPTVISIARNRRNQLKIVKDGYESYVLNNFSSKAHLQIRLKRKISSEY